MIAKKIEKALNEQIKLEAESSQFYLAMASWAETQGFGGVANFMYAHSDEERQHMLKLFKYVNERGGKAIVPELIAPPKTFKGLSEIFKSLLDHEIMISNEINKLISICLKEGDYTTQNFLQWYVAEQIEEEALARTIMDKLKLIGNNNGNLYLFDRDVESIIVTSAAASNPA
jgi:ferritin